MIKSLVQVRQPLLISPKAPGAWRALLPADPDELRLTVTFAAVHESGAASWHGRSTDCDRGSAG